MSSKKHIDDLFKEGISGYQVSPDKETRQKIEGTVFGAKSSTRKWFYTSAAAVLLMLAGLGGWYFNVEENTIPEKVIEAEPATRLNDYPAPGSTETELLFSETKPPIDKVTKEVAMQEQKTTGRPIPAALDREYGEIVLFSPNASAYAEEPDNRITAEAELSLTPSIYKEIAFMQSVGLLLDFSPKPLLIDPEKVKGMQAYLEKKKRTHLYTGLSATAAMMYYPSTKDQFTWSADLAFGLTTGKFYFETGIGYRVMKEMGIYSIEFKSNDSIGYYNEVQSFEINPLNSNEIIYKTEEVTVYDSISHYTHATPTFKYNYFNVPVSVGYKFFEKKNLSLAVETGLLFSFMTGKEIPEVDFSYPEYTHIKTMNETPERVNFNYRWQLALRFNYRFARSMSVAVKPVFTKYLNSVYDTDKAYPNVKPYSMGITIGLYYGF